MNKLKYIIVFMALLCMPSTILAAEPKLIVGGHEILNGECYNGACLDADNDKITLENTTLETVSFPGMANTIVEVKGDVVLDYSSVPCRVTPSAYQVEKIFNNIGFNNAESFTIHINENSSLTYKNTECFIEFNNVDKVRMYGEKNSSLILDNVDKGLTINNGGFSIENLNVIAKTPIYKLFSVSHESENPVVFKNVNISANQKEFSEEYGSTASLDETFILIAGSPFQIISSDIKIKGSEFYKSEESNFAMYGIINYLNPAPRDYYDMGGNIEIIDSKISLENFVIGVVNIGSNKITSSDIKVVNCIGGFEVGDLIWESGTFEDTYSLTKEDFINASRYPGDYSIGFMAMNSVKLKNGYLSFGDKVSPVQLQSTISNPTLEIDNKFTSNKKYNITTYSASESKTVTLTKEGTPSEASYTSMSEIENSMIKGLILTGKTTVHFGNGDMDDMQVDYLTDKLPENKITPPEGKQFKGWSTSKDGEIITKLGNYSEITLYPVWEDTPKEEKKEKENPNTGAIISVSCILGLLSIGVAGIAISTRYKKFY